MNFVVENTDLKPGSKSRKLSVSDLVQERLKFQPELIKAYPDMPMMDPEQIRTFSDYAYAAHDQAEFMLREMQEIKSMHESHFMTKKNKELIKDKKRLEEELDLARSIGASDAGGQEMLAQMRNQLDASQRSQ